MSEEAETTQTGSSVADVNRAKSQWLYDLLDRASKGVEQDEYARYMTNRQREPITHSDSTARETEMRLFYLKQTRLMCADKVRRSIAELEDIQQSIEDCETMLMRHAARVSNRSN